jgi:glycogen operon protein
LNDLVTYNDKHNEQNGEDNQDGTSDNRSWNCGVEGPTDDPEVSALRERQMRNLLATLFLSQGTPMLLAGDEFGRTQKGNNNAYCQDNELSWLNWAFDANADAQVHFTQKLTRLRHTYPILRRNLFFVGRYNEELDVMDVRWINANGGDMEQAQWDDEGMRCFGMLIDGRSQTTGIRQRGKEATMLLVLNSHHEPIEFTLPSCPGGNEWSLLIDTNLSVDHEEESFPVGRAYMVTARSLLLFRLAPDPNISPHGS